MIINRWYPIRISLLLILLLISVNNSMAENNLPISNFSQQSLSDWSVKSFTGQTNYQLDNIEGKTVLSAYSDNSASGLYKEIRVDLNKTPYLNWSWRIDSRLSNLNEHDKKGDDYAARLYVVKKHSVLFWKTKALNYVWSSNQNKLSYWDNAYTSQSKMFAIRGKENNIKQWYQEKRNVKEDLKRLFNEEVDNIDVVAIMTDTDNSKLSAQAFYGDIYFSSE